MALHNRVRKFSLLLAVLMAIAVTPAQAATAAGQPLIEALREGGYVLLMRHASSPTARPDKTSADRENTTLERQLDKKGRNTSRAMGAAIRALHLPIREILSSPTYRALETLRMAGLPQPRTATELGDGGQSMQPLQPSPAAWLRNVVATVPATGTDTLIVTHAPNIIAAFGANLADVADGEILVFRPDGKGDAMLAGRIKIEQWPALARLK